MSAMPGDALTALMLRAVSPLVPGTITGDGMVLEAVESYPATRLCFLGPRGYRFAIRFQRSRPGAKYFATTGRIDVILDTSAQPPQAVERFVRALAAGVGRNTVSMSDDELGALESRSGPAESVPPALRRRATIGAANLLDVNVGDGCNLSCTFCTDVDSRGREMFRPTSFWQDELGRAREKGKAGLLISGNEPTLRPDLPEIVATARRLGFVEIELSTAGVRLADRAYLAELLAAGVNVLAVSIHGSNAVTDGAQTGRPDFFDSRRRGFEHFLEMVGDRAAQDRGGVYLKTITIFTRSNLSDIPALVTFLDRHEVSYILLHYPWIKGAAAQRFDEVVPDYASVMKALQPLRARLEQPSGCVALANLPPCVTSDLPAGRTSSKDILRPSMDGNEGTRPFLRVVSAMDPTLTHARCCEGCVLRERCGGVPRRYLQRHGEAGLRAMRGDERGSPR